MKIIATQPKRLHSIGVIETVAIGEDPSNTQLRDTLLRFIGQDPIENKLSLALCPGKINLQTGQVEGNTHWTALHLRRFVNNGSVFIQAYYMDSLGGAVPALVEKILSSIVKTSLQDLHEDLAPNLIYQRAVDHIKNIRFQPCKVLPCQRQLDGHSCGDRTVFNLIALHFIENPMKLPVDTKIIQDSQFISIEAFIVARRKDLEQNLNVSTYQKTDSIQPIITAPIIVKSPLIQSEPKSKPKPESEPCFEIIEGGKEPYTLLRKITLKEAAEIQTQTGCAIAFMPGRKWASGKLGAGAFGVTWIGRNSKGQYITVKKITGVKAIQDSQEEAKIQLALNGSPYLMSLQDFFAEGSENNPTALYNIMPLAGLGSGEELAKHLRKIADPEFKRLVLT